MSHDLSAFFHPAKKLQLSTSEKTSIRAAIFAETEDHVPEILSQQERGSMHGDLRSFVNEFPHRYSGKPALVSFAVIRDLNLFGHLQPFCIPARP